jgi:hypothetical protein
MDLLGAANESHRSDAIAPGIEGGMSRGNYLWMIGETKIVVSTEVCNLASIL